MAHETAIHDIRHPLFSWMYRLVTSRTCSTCDWPAKWEDLDGTRYCDLHADEAGEAAEERAKAIKERADAEAAVGIIAEGLRVLRTRDGVPLTDDMILERARNIAAGLTGVRLDGVRFAARRAPTAEDEANAKEVIR